jgi:hypothetical protein
MQYFRELKPASRWALVVLGSGLLGAFGAAGIPAVRHSLLRSAGWLLVAQDAPAKADIIVISTDALGAGILEAADLLHTGVATRVAIFTRTQTPVQREFARRGVQSPDVTTVSIQLLRKLGITAVEQIPPVVGTEDEGKVLQQWCAANAIHSIVFVSTADHSRRTRRVLARALVQHGVKVIVRYARLSDFAPDSWWQTRGGQRTEAVEAEKLFLDILRHPFA